MLAEGLATFQADFRPSGLWQRLGGYQQALYRQLVIAQRRQAGGIAFHRRHHPLRAQLALVGAQQAGAPVGDAAFLEQLHAQAFDGPGEGAGQFGRLDGRAMGCVDRSERAGDAQLAAQFGGRQPAVVGLAQTFAIKVGEILAQPALLLGVACGAVQHAALAVVAVDAFALQYPFDFVRNVVQQAVGFDALFAGQAGEQAIFAKQIAHQPAAIAAGGAEAGGFRLDDGDLQVRCAGLQVIGRPQAGIARAGNRHVDVQRPFQGRARDEIVVQLVHPQADMTPCRHGRLRIR
ncbi:hypothetical protein D9M71_279110 [compost metagenome]